MRVQFFSVHDSQSLTAPRYLYAPADGVALMLRQTLLNVLKRETVNLVKKKQSSS